MPRHCPSRSLPVSLALALAACGGGGSSGPEVVTEDLARSTGALSCGPSLLETTRLEREITDLAAAGVPVVRARCGSDGQPRPAACGLDAGELWIIRTAAETAPLARARGYRPLADIPAAAEQACR
ncbi:hypothetical protein [Piscinibacter sakaiensis]|uniref:Lipoprotein n=1 Tax=Piscinibacter sakaiensis TaxID=1547922 RepID=A0A0K8P5Y4_PISS1|nr:hypothetical protein [Piscinibacter sakaiensis]GAP37996.1 hypothetical protein ISF6_4190 [Piscinibacter sakaiensis]